jgi:hypothetical protein
MPPTYIINPNSQSPSAAYGLFFQEGDIIRAARGARWNFYKDTTTRTSLYYFNTTDKEDYIGRTTGVLVRASGGYYLEVQRPAPAFGLFPGTLVPNFASQTGFIFMGDSVEYFYQNFAIDGRVVSNTSKVIDTTATPTGAGGSVEIVKQKVEPTPTNVPTPQPKGPMYALIAVLAIAGISILYLTFKKPAL